MDDEFEPSEDEAQPRMSKDWVPDDAIAALVMDRTVHGEETQEQLARRLLRENLPVAVVGIIHTAQHGENSRIRLDAQKYVVERVLGKVGDDAFGADASPLDDFSKAMTAAAEAYANAQSSKPQE